MKDESETVKVKAFWFSFLLCVLVLLHAASVRARAAESGPSWDGRPARLADIEIHIQDPYARKTDWPSLARVLMELKRGDVLNAERLAQARRSLSPLAQVDTDVVVRSDGLLLRVRLTPYGRIKTIEIDGNYPLLEKEVRNALTVSAGDVFRPADMPQQEKLVARLYREKGYVDPQVHITWSRDETDGHFHLAVHIEKGPHYTLDQVILHGNRSIGDAALKFRMSTWRRSVFSLGTSRFTRQRFEKDARRLTDYYRSRGFAEVAIDAAFSVHGPRNRQVAAELNIREGPLYKITFQGNRHFSDRKLRKDLVLFEYGNRGNIGLRRSIYKIRRRYLRAGCADVRVRRQDPTAASSPAVRPVTIAIDEGRRRAVEQITVQGNDRIDDRTIRKQMLTRPKGLLNQGAYMPAVLQEDITAIEALYRNRGYLSARIDDHVAVDPQTARVRIDIRIAEGPRTIVDKVVLEGERPPAAAHPDKGLRLKPGDPYVPFALRDDQDALATRISPHGYPYVDVQGAAQLSGDRKHADVQYNIQTGPHVQVGRLFFVGNFKTRDGFMRREMGFASGDDFSLKGVLQAQRKLRNLNIFDAVQVHTIGLKQRRDKVHLLVRTVEKKPCYFLAGGGYQTDKGFYGRTKIGDYNFTGTAKDLWLSAELSQAGYRTGIGIGEPRLFGTTVRADASLFVERSEPFNQDFGTDTFGARTSVSRGWGAHVSTGLGLRYERRDQFLREESVSTSLTDPSAFDPRSIVVTTPSVMYDSRDSFIRPHAGQLVSAAVDISKGLDNNLDDFLKYRFEARAYHALFSRLTLAGRVWAGYLDPYGGDQPPLDQLFFLGGATTVRGFKENMLRFDADGNPVGGQLAMAAGFEARIDVGYNFELIPFVDTGSVQRAVVDAGSDAFRWSAGLGVEYVTPIGPIGVFYGHKLDRRSGESAGAWHLSVGYTF